MPHHIGVGQMAPSPAHLRSFAEGDGVQVAEDFVGYFDGQRSQEIDLKLFLNFASGG